jgi:hypothetical protein
MPSIRTRGNPLRAKPLSTGFSLEIGLFLLALLARGFSLFRLASSPFLLSDSGDMKFYHVWAMSISHGNWTDGQAFYGLPGYAFFLAAIYWIADFVFFLAGWGHSLPLGQPHPLLIGSMQAVADALIAVLIFKIARGVFSTESISERKSLEPGFCLPELIGFTGALGWILFEPAQTFSMILMPTTWLVLTFWFVVYCILSVKAAPPWKPWLGVGALIGVVAMMVATILFLVPLLLAAIISKVRPFRSILAASFILLAGVFAGLSPCWIHNYFLAKEPVLLSAHSGVNLYIGNNPLANGYPRIPPGLRAGQAGMLKDSITMAELVAGHKLKRFEVSQFWSLRAKRYIREHLWDWTKLMGVKFVNFWNSFQYDDLSLVSLFSQERILIPGLRFGVVAALGIPGLIMVGWKNCRSRWIVAAILLHMAALLPVFITERYRLAVVPGLLIMASAGAFEFWRAICRSNWSFGATYFAIAFLSAGFVSRAPSDEALWSLDYYNTGIKAIEAGRFDLAQFQLERAYAYSPSNSEVNFALGNLWIGRKNREKAKLFYTNAIKINPRHSGAFNNLGVFEMEEKHWENADQLFQRSLAVEPDDAKTMYLLAKTKLALGRPQEARALIVKALMLKPDQPEFERLRNEINSGASSQQVP